MIITNPIGICKVEIYDTETEYKLARLLCEEKKLSARWHNLSKILVVVNILLCIYIIFS